MRALRIAPVAALLIGALGCSSGGSNNDGAGGSTGAGGGGGGATGGGGGSATNATCQAIRICALDCGNDDCIMNNCKPMGTVAAQSAFQSLLDCTVDPARGNCPSYSDVNCMCMAQYLQDPPCADLLTACIGDITDMIAARCNG